MMKNTRRNAFSYFERKQFEDYLNNKSSLGYHIKITDHRAGFVYEPDKHCYYHVDVSNIRRFPNQVVPNNDYIELFESQGYHFLGNIEYFHVFMSDKKESIFGNNEEKQNIKDILLTDIKYAILWIITEILWVYLRLYNIKNFDMNELILWGLFILTQVLFVFIRYVYPVIKYKLTDDLSYSFISILKREYFRNCLMLVSFLFVVPIFLKKLLYFSLAIILLLVISIFCVYRYVDNIEKSSFLEKMLRALDWIVVVGLLSIMCGLLMTS